MRYVLLLLLVGPCWAQAEWMWLAGPEAATRDDLTKCAKAMAARAKAYGYRDVLAEVAEHPSGPALRISAKSGPLSAEMRERIIGLSRLAGSDAEIRFVRSMTAAELEQYRPGRWDHPEEDRTVEGSRWVRLMKRNGEDDAWDESGVRRGKVAMLLDQPKVAWKNTDIADGDENTPWGRKRFIQVDAASTKRLGKVLDSNPRAYVVVNGRALELTEIDLWLNREEMVRTPNGGLDIRSVRFLAEKAAIWIPAAAYDRDFDLILIMLEHPMPIRLRTP